MKFKIITISALTLLMTSFSAFAIQGWSCTGLPNGGMSCASIGWTCIKQDANSSFNCIATGAKVAVRGGALSANKLAVDHAALLNQAYPIKAVLSNKAKLQ